MQNNQKKCIEEMENEGVIAKKYYGQVFTTDELILNEFINNLKKIYKKGSKIIEIGGGLGYITEKLIKNFENIECIEFDEDLYKILNKKFIHNKNIKIINDDILNYKAKDSNYILVGNIPFHISGKLYRKFMSDEEHKPYAMLFITDKQYAKTLMGQPPRAYRVSLQAQAYGDISIIKDVAPNSVYPEPKVMCCIMQILQNKIKLPDNFWKTVNYHWENFPTKEVESPKTMGLENWIKLCKKSPL